MTDTYDTSDPKAVAKAVKTAKQRDELRAEGLRQLMSSEAGRVWLFDLIKTCGPGQNPFRSDAYLTAFNCGELNIGNQVVAQCHACSVELYLVMMKENQDG